MNETSANSAGKYVLIVGADVKNLVFMSMLLQRLDYHICTAGSAETCLELARVVTPDLILTDLKLPGMHAPQMMRRLRENERTAHVPVIMTLEQLAPKIVQKCREAGAVACIVKPPQPDDLYRAVQAATEARPREHIRIRTRLSVLVNDRQLDFDAGEGAVMLSARGMYVRTRTRYPVRTKFPVRITLNGNRISVGAKVIYSHDAGEGPFGEPGMGLYFETIEPQDQEHLQRHINDEVVRGMPQPQCGNGAS